MPNETRGLGNWSPGFAQTGLAFRCAIAGSVTDVRARGSEMKSNIVGKPKELWLRSISSARALGHGVKRGVIRGTAIAAMLVIYAASSIGTLTTSSLGIAGISGLALTAASAKPAEARRWRRRRRYGGYRGWGGPGFYGYGGWGGPWRRRRRRRGFNIYLSF